MTARSGWVAKFDAEGVCHEVRDLGPEPVECRDGFPGALPLVDVFPGGEGAEHAPPALAEIAAVDGQAVRTWIVTRTRLQALHALVRARRWEEETGGMTWNGQSLATSEASASKVSGAVELFDKDPTLQAIDFEAQPNAWITVNKAALTAAGVAIGRHIQRAFSQARAFDEALDAEGADLDAIQAEIAAPWDLDP